MLEEGDRYYSEMTYNIMKDWYWFSELSGTQHKHQPARSVANLRSISLREKISFLAISATSVTFQTGIQSVGLPKRAGY